MIPGETPGRGQQVKVMKNGLDANLHLLLSDPWTAMVVNCRMVAASLSCTSMSFSSALS
jgi:hypothetical protein